ncbi:MAG: SDR family oxidoreductase [Patescibacteria group bacterium]
MAEVQKKERSEETLQSQEPVQNREMSEEEPNKEAPILVFPEKPAIIIDNVDNEDAEKINKIQGTSTLEDKKIEVGAERKEKQVFVTGSTGLVGSNLIHELTEKGYEIFALARAKKGETAEERVAKALRIINPNFDTSLADAGIKIFEGDLLQKNLGLKKEQLEQLKEIESAFNMAADVSFSEEKRKLIMKVNYDGTENLIDLLYKIGKPHLHHASTAYIFGDLAERPREHSEEVPVFKETDLDVGQKFRNPYEESKFRAEKLLDSNPNFLKTIYRLGIVIGDSETYQTNAFNAFYGFWRVFDILKRSLAREMKNLKKRQYYEEFDIKFEGDILHLPIQIPGEPNCTLNLVPVDWVVKSIVALSEHPLIRKKNFTFHITHDKPPIQSEIAKVALQTLGIEKVEVNPRATMQFLTQYPLEEALKSEDPRHRMMAMILQGVSDYIPYIYGEPKIDTSIRNGIKNSQGNILVPPPPKITNEFMREALLYALKRGFRPQP